MKAVVVATTKKANWKGEHPANIGTTLAGMDRLQKSMNAYVKWLSRRGETFEDKEKGLPVSYLGRTMISHGEDFEADSEFGNCLIGTYALEGELGGN